MKEYLLALTFTLLASCDGIDSKLDRDIKDAIVTTQNSFYDLGAAVGVNCSLRWATAEVGGDGHHESTQACVAREKKQFFDGVKIPIK